MIHKGDRPEGWTTTPEAWTYLTRRGKKMVAALMRRIEFDDTQVCLGNDLYIKDAPYDSEEKDYLEAHCQGCTFFTACCEYALAHEEHNYYAGMTAEQRKRVRAERGIMLVHRDTADLHGLIPVRDAAA